MTSFKSMSAVAAALFISSALAGFDPSSQSNVAVYWGMLQYPKVSSTCTNMRVQAKTQPVKPTLKPDLRSIAMVRSEHPDAVANIC